MLLYILLSCLQKEEPLTDMDGDGFSDMIDCDDTKSEVYPDANEVCDGVDNNCNGDVDEGYPLLTLYLDNDGDSYGAELTDPFCVALTGTSSLSGDCDDDNDEVHPNAPEFCDGLDNDCNNVIDDEAVDRVRYYLDSDGDGYGRATQSVLLCEVEAGYVLEATDCNDGLATVYPDASEICDGYDNDCDGLEDEQDPDLDWSTGALFYRDVDEDGYGDPVDSLQRCTAPIGYIENADDCNDLNPDQNPSHTSDWCDGYDNDCDGVEDEDVKADWPLMTINDGYAGIVEIGSTTGLVGNIHNSNTLSNFITMDVNAFGMAYGISNNWPDRMLIFSACQSQVVQSGFPISSGRLACGLTFGPGGGLYSLNDEDDSLYRLSLNGIPTLIGSLGIDVTKECGLTYDCKRDMLVGISPMTGEVYSIDHLKGEAYDFRQTTVPITGSFGIEYDATTGSILIGSGVELYSVDPLSGNTTMVGTLTGSEITSITNLAFHPECP